MFGNILSSIFSEAEMEASQPKHNCGCSKCRQQQEMEQSFEGEQENFLGNLFSRYFPSTAVSTPAAAFAPEDFTAQVDYTKCRVDGTTCRGPIRPLSQIDAIVLHQTAGTNSTDPNRYLRVGAHFVVMPDGRVLQLYPEDRTVWHGNSFNRRSVGIEFAGTFPNEKGICWWDCTRDPATQKCLKGIYKKRGHAVQNRACASPTAAQYKSGQQLLTYLANKIPSIQYVFAHRQSSHMRDNDPGPELWCNVGEWAIQNIGLTNGPTPNYASGGTAIPASWRCASASTLREFEFEF